MVLTHAHLVGRGGTSAATTALSRAVEGLGGLHHHAHPAP